MKTIIVIGGSKGIGEAILEELLIENKVINISRSQPKIDHANLIHHGIDVLTDDLPNIEEASGLVYCPGSINLKPLTSLKLEDFEYDFQINVLGAVRVVKKYYKLLRKSGDGSIVLFSTVAVGQGMSFHSSIAAAKGAVEALSRSLAAEFAPKVRVNCIAPTLTQTTLAQNLLRNETMIENAKSRHPLNKILEPEDVSRMAVFLLSEYARSITGQVIGIDAGMSTLRT